MEGGGVVEGGSGVGGGRGKKKYDLRTHAAVTASFLFFPSIKSTSHN